jgi:hypothetical protein
MRELRQSRRGYADEMKQRLNAMRNRLNNSTLDGTNLVCVERAPPAPRQAAADARI